MKNVSLNVMSLWLFVAIAGCTTITNEQPINPKIETAVPGDANTVAGTPEVQNTPALPAASDVGGTFIGGAVEQAMDETDRSKMMHAMDKAPGKSTHWTNVNTHMQYTVTPIKKIHFQDKDYCRQYQMTAMDANEKEQSVQGVACIASDGNWHTVQG
jgi:surface antigen